MKSNSSLLYSCVLVVGDFLALVAAFVVAYLIRGRFSDVPVAHPIPAREYVQAFWLLLPFWILVFGMLGLYARNIYEKRFHEMGRLLVGSFIGLLFLTSYAYAVDTPLFPSKLVAVYGFVLSFIFLVLLRSLVRFVRSLLFSYDVGITNLLVVGNTKMTDELVESLADSRDSGYRIIGIVTDHPESDRQYRSLKVFPSFEQAVKKLKGSDIHAIFQTELYPSNNMNDEILEFAQTHHIAYRLTPGNGELFMGKLDVELFRSAIPTISVHQTSLIGWGRAIKRAADVLLALVSLVIALPFMVVIAVMQKVFSPLSPIFYKEVRLTRFGKPVNIYKFRSLKKAYSGMTPEEAFHKMKRPELIEKYRANGDYIANDPRISRFGSILRRASLDELPQLINILKGDISFVGPRALQRSELEQFGKKDLILAVKSGLTGLAQVSGRRDISFEERRKLDLFYVQNWSLWLDISILIKTIRVVLKRNGAR